MKNNVLISFDYGTKRIGVAVGQCVTQTARPLPTLEAKDNQPDWQKIKKLLLDWRPDAFVVGIPLNMDGTEQPLTQLAKQFADELQQRFNIPVYGVDERLTTRDARERVFKQGGYKALKKTEVDGVAAQLILETWFMQQEN